MHVHLLVESGIHIIEALNLERTRARSHLRISLCGRAHEDSRRYGIADPSAGALLVKAFGKLRDRDDIVVR